METAEFDARYVRLLANLRSMADLLRDAGVEGWPDWVERAITLINAGDAFGLTHMLGAYGGMGSLNDLVIDPRNGHTVTDDEADLLDRELIQLRSAVWDDATALQNDLR
jgi:hypothetical protein